MFELHQKLKTMKDKKLDIEVRLTLNTNNI